MDAERIERINEGYRAGRDYGQRGMGVTPAQAERRGDDYLQGYEDGYASAWTTYRANDGA